MVIVPEPPIPAEEARKACNREATRDFICRRSRPWSSSSTPVIVKVSASLEELDPKFWQNALRATRLKGHEEDFYAARYLSLKGVQPRLQCHRVRIHPFYDTENGSRMI